MSTEGERVPTGIALREAIAKAIETDNAGAIGRIAARLMLRGMRYAEIFDLARSVRPSLDAGAWDALLYEADESEAQS